MPKKKSEEESVETTEAATEETETAAEDSVVEAKTEVETDEKPKKTDGKKKAEATDESDEPSIIDSVVSTVAAAVETVAEVVSSGVSSVVSAVTGSSGEADTTTVEKHSKRAEKVGIVSSDKMTNTVTVRVDRVVKHPIYRKYIKRRKKFMAHDETGAGIGDKVRIMETRPLSARKRWRVVEIIQKAEK